MDNLTRLFNNLEDTASDMDSFEVLVKVDDDDSELISYMEKEREKRPFVIKYIATPKLDGYWSLYQAYNELSGMSSPETYFVFGINDETNFLTRQWDKILRNYIGYFPDDIFHLRISMRRNLEYKSFVESIPGGENYPFFTKKWLSLTEGIAIGEAGIDTGQESVNYFVRTKCGYKRGVVVDDIKIADEDLAVSASYGLSSREWSNKVRRIYKLYARLLTREKIENFYRLARKINADIWANENNLDDFEIEDDKTNKTILVKSSSNSDPLLTLPYEIDVLSYLSILLNVEPILLKIDWDKWPPLLANRIRARRQLAEQWLNTAPELIEDACSSDLGKAHKMLTSTNLKYNTASLVMQFHTQEVLKILSNKPGEFDESTFVNGLIDRLLSEPDGEKLAPYMLAALLYCRAGELTAEGIDLTSIPKWFLDASGSGKVKKTGLDRIKKMFRILMPQTARRAFRFVLMWQKSIIEKILE
jgi:hypothetical protein